MNEISILERIVEEEGSCCWATSAICDACPLGKTARQDKKGYMSCVEAVGIEGLSEEEADAKYKAAALNKLADLTLQKIIET